MTAVCTLVNPNVLTEARRLVGIVFSLLPAFRIVGVTSYRLNVDVFNKLCATVLANREVAELNLTRTLRGLPRNHNPTTCINLVKTEIGGVVTKLIKSDIKLDKCVVRAGVAVAANTGLYAVGSNFISYILVRVESGKDNSIHYESAPIFGKSTVKTGSDRLTLAVISRKSYD